MKSNLPQNNYQKGMQQIEKIKASGVRPTLLLHSCCAPCNTYPLELLAPVFELTLYFNNSNIYPFEEFTRRLEELRHYVDNFNHQNGTHITMVVPPYHGDAMEKKLGIRKDDKEGQGRCRYCYATRMNEAYEYAKNHHFDYFTTVMTISRQKDSTILNKIGAALERIYGTPQYLYSDFKKKKGIDRAVTLSKQYQLYRQTYCGCRFSYLESLKKKHDPNDDPII